MSLLLVLDQLGEDNRQPPGFLVGKFADRLCTEALGKDYALVTWLACYRESGIQFFISGFLPLRSPLLPSLEGFVLAARGADRFTRWIRLV